MDEFHDLRVLRGRTTRIVLDNGELDEISESFFAGAAIRALSGGAWGFVQTESLDDLTIRLDHGGIHPVHRGPTHQSDCFHHAPLHKNTEPNR